MISKDIAQLVVEVAELIGERQRAKAEAEPEVSLVALLKRIIEREKKSRVSALLDSTIMSSFFEDYHTEAREFLKKREEASSLR